MTSVSHSGDSVSSASGPGVSRFLTAGEVADILRVKPQQVLEMCREGRLRATKPGKTWLITAEDVEAYIAAGYNDQASA